MDKFAAGVKKYKIIQRERNIFVKLYLNIGSEVIYTRMELRERIKLLKKQGKNEVAAKLEKIYEEVYL